LLVGDKVFELEFCGFVFDYGAALITIELLDFFQLGDDDLAQLFLGAENRFEFGNVLARDAQLFIDFVDRKPRQAVQLQFENGVGLDRGERLLRAEFRSAAGGVDINLLAAEECD
jgi:hypothetical protein